MTSLEMSFHPNHRKFLRATPNAYAEEISSALRASITRTRESAKHVALRVGATPKTVQNWLGARNGPTGAQLIELIAQDDEVYARVLELAGRAPAQITDRQRQAAVAALRLLSGTDDARGDRIP